MELDFDELDLHPCVERKKLLEHRLAQASSLGRRKILGLGEVSFPLVRYKVGNGDNAFLWFDPWHPRGLLYHKVGERGITLHCLDLGVMLKLTLLSWMGCGDGLLLEMQTS